MIKLFMFILGFLSASILIHLSYDPTSQWNTTKQMAANSAKWGCIVGGGTHCSDISQKLKQELDKL